VQLDGSISTYRADDFNLDQVNEGRVLLTLLDRTRDRRYRHAADLLRQQLRTQPRTAEGGFWHKQIYPQQMWLDGLYMAEPFYAEYARRFGVPADFDDIARQFLLVARHLKDARTGLYYHAWDAVHVQPWADPVTGLSKHFWGAPWGGISWRWWTCWTCCPQRIATAPRSSASCATSPRPWRACRTPPRGSGGRCSTSRAAPRTTSRRRPRRCSCTRWPRARAADILDKKFRDIATVGFDGLVGTLIVTGADGLPSLTGVCKVAGLGGNPPRDGSYEYYVSEPVVADDYKGVGPFILAALELNR